MANLNTPISAAKTKEHMEDTKRNPETKVGGNVQAGQVVHVTLRFTGGQTVKPREIYEMVDAKFGTVSSLKDTAARGAYEFQIE